MLNKSEIEKFWSRVDKSGDCWLWTGGKRPSGNINYGIFQVKIDGKWKGFSTHRLSYELATGKSPGDAFVCHTCDNGLCVKPQHLFLGTHTDNMQDCARKDRRKHTVLTNAIVMDARKRCSQGEYVSEIAKEYGVNYKNLSNAVKDGWSHLEIPPVPDAKVKKYRKANKLSRQDYEEIVEALKKPYWGQVNDLAKKYGCGHPLISHIKTGRWKPTTISVRE